MPMQDSVSAVTVYWRPGCPYCFLLRRSLRRVGIPTHEINIWDDPSAAELVRSHADGNETVPTVKVGEEVLVNPRASAVLEILRERGDLPSRSTVDAMPGTTGPWLMGFAAAVAAAFVWVLLARAQPTTTYHAAPPLIVVAWPFVQGAVSALPPSRVNAALGSAGGALVALVTTWFLARAGDLEGPTVIHGRGAAVEAVVFIMVAAVATFLTSLRRRRRHRR